MRRLLSKQRKDWQPPVLLVRPRLERVAPALRFRLSASVARRHRPSGLALVLACLLLASAAASLRATSAAATPTQLPLLVLLAI